MLSETTKTLHKIKQEVDLKAKKSAIDTSDDSLQKLKSKPPSLNPAANKKPKMINYHLRLFLQYHQKTQLFH